MLRTLIASCAAAALLCAAGAAQSATLVYIANMDGATEVPPNLSTAFGFTTVTVDNVLNTMQVNITYAGLTGGAPAAAHIHCCSAPGTNVGVAVGFPNFPTTTSGTFSQLFNLLDPTIYTSGFLTGCWRDSWPARPIRTSTMLSSRAAKFADSSTPCRSPRPGR
jgi:hypothetical protein